MKFDTSLEFPELLRNFDRVFELSLATSEAQRQAVYRFRYRIFCEKLGFVDPRPFPDRRETDDFDDHSVHCFVTHRASGRIAGCVRLVTADSSTEMPLERRCQSTLDPVAPGPSQYRRNRIAEISRLAVGYPFSGTCREKNREQVEKDLNQFSPDERQTFPLIAVSLMLAAGASADLLRRTQCFALMERSLRARLRRLGISTTRVGQDIEYSGTVAPYLLDIDQAAHTLPDHLGLFYHSVRKQVESSIRPATPRPAFGDRAASPAYPAFSGMDLGLA